MIRLNENTIVRVSFFASLALVVVLSVTLGSIFFIDRYRQLDTGISELETNFIASKKDRIKEAVLSKIDDFKTWHLLMNESGEGEPSNRSQESLKQAVIRVINRQGDIGDSREYLFILDLHDISGGDAFATMLVNPNRTDLVGRHLSDNYRDARGYTFRKEFLKGLRETGEAFVDYWYKKPGSSEVHKKITYFKLFPDWQWIVAKGFYLDDLEKQIALKKQAFKETILKNLMQFMVVILIAVGVVLAVHSVIANRLTVIFRSYREKQNDYQKELELAREALEQKVRRRTFEIVRASEELRRKDLQYRTFVDNAMDAILVIQNEVIRFANPVTETFLKTTGNTIASVDFRTLVYPRDWETVRDFYHKTLAGASGSEMLSFRIGSDHGKILWVQMNATAIDWEGSPGVLCFARDITEKKYLMQQLRQTRKMESLGTLAGGIAHDFNNILSSVIGYSELALYEAGEDSSIGKKLQHILRAGKRAGALTGQILTFCRRQAHEMKPMKIRTILEEVIALLRPTIPASIEIKTMLESQAMIFGDPTHIHQVMMNICSNAQYAMRKTGGVMAISLTDIEFGAETGELTGEFEPGHYVKLMIQDTGEGMTPQIRKTIFDPFFTTKEKGQGTGLGMSVVHGIVQNHQGVIHISSAPGKGSSIEIFFPVITNEENGPQVDEFPLSRGTERILFVDDDPAVAELNGISLRQLGYRVQTFTSSSEALALFEADPSGVDLVITDMDMPGLNGEEFSKKLLAARPDIPVILCTGFNVMINRLRADSIGIRAIMTKPILQRKLGRVVRGVLDSISH